jgi:hypothetical protein
MDWVFGCHVGDKQRPKQQAPTASELVYAAATRTFPAVQNLHLDLDVLL